MIPLRTLLPRGGGGGTLPTGLQIWSLEGENPKWKKEAGKGGGGRLPKRGVSCAAPGRGARFAGRAQWSGCLWGWRPNTRRLRAQPPKLPVFSLCPGRSLCSRGDRVRSQVFSLKNVNQFPPALSLRRPIPPPVAPPSLAKSPHRAVPHPAAPGGLCRFGPNGHRHW